MIMYFYIKLARTNKIIFQIEKNPHIEEAYTPLSEVVPYCCLIQALAFVEELSNVITGVLQKIIFNQELNPLGTKTEFIVNTLHALPTSINPLMALINHLLWVHVELLAAHCHLLVSLHVFPDKDILSQTKKKITGLL